MYIALVMSLMFKLRSWLWEAASPLHFKSKHARLRVSSKATPSGDGLDLKLSDWSRGMKIALTTELLIK